MRLYGGRLIRKALRQQLQERQEMRDAIVFDVNAAERYCRVRIQGSNTLIKARFPENYEAQPQYIKTGNAVRITHPGGNKSRVEVTGHGILIPTILPGGIPPVLPDPGDTVLTGGTLSPSDPPSMAVTVAPGTIRIDGLVYSIQTLEMDRADIIMDRADLIMDGVSTVVALDPAHATLFRYDSIVVGKDGIVDVVKGANFAHTAAVIPDPPWPPEDHVRLGWVLIYPGMTAVTAADINRLFTKPVAAELRVTIDKQELHWPQTSATISVSIRDQYGNRLPHDGAGYYVTVTWTAGTGSLRQGGIDHTSAEGPFSFYMHSYTSLYYTREETDKSPVWELTEAETRMSSGTYCLNYDSLGELVM